MVATLSNPDYTGSATGTLVISKATGTVTLGSLAQAYTGSPLAATATTVPPGMNVTFTYDGSATPPTASGSYTVVGTLANANYSGSATGTLIIGKAARTVSVWPTASTITYGATLASATLTGGTAATPGTFSWTAPATMPAAGTASFAVTFTPADLAIYPPATGTVSVTTLQAPANLVVTGSGPAYFGQPVTLSAAVSNAIDIPTGTVTFRNGSVVLATLPLADGRAALTTSTLDQGTDTITASYSGDANDLPSLASPLDETVYAPAVVVTVPPAPLACSAGGSGSTQVTLGALGTLSGPITFKVAGLPEGTTLTFSNSSVTLINGSAVDTVTLSTTPSLRLIGQLKGLQPGTGLGISGSALISCGLLLPMARRKRKASMRPDWRLGMLLAAVALLCGQSACSSNNASTGMTPTGTPAGQYQVTVTASAEGATPAIFALNLTVN